MLDWLRNNRPDDYSIRRLKRLYVQLLMATDLAGSQNLGRRKIDPQDLAPGSPILKKKVSSPMADEEDSAAKRSLSTAFKLLAATPAADKEGENGGALGLRDDSTVSSMSQAQRLELQLVKLVRCIGEVVAFGDEAGTSFRSDPVFEYFCEKSILSLLVDIAKAKPSSESKLHASSWSPMVKAEIFHTVSGLVSNAQDGPSLYYLLSNNSVNDLIACMLPLRQWTDPALSTMLPEYTSLLKSLVLQLSASPADIFTFLKTSDTFPLFSSTVEVALSPKADYQARHYCLNLVVAMLKLPDPSVRNWISNSETDLQRLSSFVCTRLMDRYHHMAEWITGPVVDPKRCNHMKGQLVDVKNQIKFINQLLCCGVKAFNVQFCEIFLRAVVAILLENLCSKNGRQFLPVGVSDIDVIPEDEGLAQLSLVFFLHLWSISYPPLCRMIAVALFHPKSTKLWKMAKYKAIKEEYALTRELDAIVKTPDAGFAENSYRKELLAMMEGAVAGWMFIPASMVVEGALTNSTLGTEVLVSFGLLPDFADTKPGSYPKSPLEEALACFVLRKQTVKSAAATMALERAGATALCIFSQVIAWGGKRVATFLHHSPLFQAFAVAHGHFCQQALEARKKTGVSDLFVDLTQLAIRNRYPKIRSKDAESQLQYGCVLDNFGFHSLALNSEILIRKFRTVGSDDVEDCRFAIQMALQFRAICNIVNCIVEAEQHVFPTTDWADDLLLTIGDLNEKPVKGTDLDLRGRMVFNFHAASNRFEQKPNASPNATGRRLSNEIVLRPKAQFVLVLDPTDIFVVTPLNRREVNRGTIICGVSLRKIIACASDADWLHIAVRNMDDVGFLIKNGNMALHFDTVGTALIVQQYLERSQGALRNELKEQIETLFEEKLTLSETKSENGSSSSNYEEVKPVAEVAA